MVQGDEICLDNRPTGSTQMFKIKARLRINTQSALKDLVIADEALCVDRPQPPPKPVVKLTRDESVRKARKIKADIIFLVDQSESIKKDNWNAIMSFVSKTIRAVSGGELPATKSEHRYAMRGFGADADELFFSLADYARNPAQKQRDILKIERENKGGTMTHLALDKVVSDDLKTMRADAMKVVIVVTDGESTKPELTKKSAALLKSKNVSVVAVGIEGAEAEELEEIASKPSYIEEIKWADIKDEKSKAADNIQKTILSLFE